MKFYIEEHKYKNGDCHYILWFDHQTGLDKVKCGTYYEIDEAINQLNLSVERLNWPKITVIKEVIL
jgi:hypothetical protein